jgi:hypothetical protein
MARFSRAERPRMAPALQEVNWRGGNSQSDAVRDYYASNREVCERPRFGLAAKDLPFCCSA